jgi:hypothetical protein
MTHVFEKGFSFTIRASCKWWRNGLIIMRGRMFRVRLRLRDAVLGSGLDDGQIAGLPEVCDW